MHSNVTLTGEKAVRFEGPHAPTHAIDIGYIDVGRPRGNSGYQNGHIVVGHLLRALHGIGHCTAGQTDDHNQKKDCSKHLIPLSPWLVIL